MAVIVAVQGVSGEETCTTLPERVVCCARLLRSEPDRYFVIDADTVMLPVTALVHTRIRDDGIKHAIELMKLAYEGKHGRRAPLSVELRNDGRYLILDGNSTAAVATAAGWFDVPSKISRRS